MQRTPGPRVCLHAAGEKGRGRGMHSRLGAVQSFGQMCVIDGSHMACTSRQSASAAAKLASARHPAT